MQAFGVETRETETVRAFLRDAHKQLVDANPLAPGLKHHVLEDQLPNYRKLAVWLGLPDPGEAPEPACPPHERILLRLASTWAQNDRRASQRRAMFKDAAGHAYAAWVALLTFAAAARMGEAAMEDA